MVFFLFYFLCQLSLSASNLLNRDMLSKVISHYWNYARKFIICQSLVSWSRIIYSCLDWVKWHFLYSFMLYSLWEDCSCSISDRVIYASMTIGVHLLYTLIVLPLTNSMPCKCLFSVSNFVNFPRLNIFTLWYYIYST